MRHDAAHAPARARFALLALIATSLPAVAVEVIPAPAPKPADAAKSADPAKQDDAKKSAEATKKPDSRDGRCDVCGSGECVRKVCVPKPKEREIKKVCWSYKCEDFCIPGPSDYCGRKCGTQDECGHWFFDVWKPTCAEIRTKKVPVKTEVKRKVPGVEWTPEERCASCRSKRSDGTWPALGSTR